VERFYLRYMGYENETMFARKESGGKSDLKISATK
jgi:hypothetical protein